MKLALFILALAGSACVWHPVRCPSGTERLADDGWSPAACWPGQGCYTHLQGDRVHSWGVHCPRPGEPPCQSYEAPDGRAFYLWCPTSWDAGYPP